MLWWSWKTFTVFFIFIVDWTSEQGSLRRGMRGRASLLAFRWFWGLLFSGSAFNDIRSIRIQLPEWRKLWDNQNPWVNVAYFLSINSRCLPDDVGWFKDEDFKFAEEKTFRRLARWLSLLSLGDWPVILKWICLKIIAQNSIFLTSISRLFYQNRF